MEQHMSHTCPYCGQTFPLIEGFTYSEQCVDFAPGKVERDEGILRMASPHFVGGHKGPMPNRETVWIRFKVCPNCWNTSLEVSTVGGSLKSKSFVYPTSTVKQYPDYVPEQIRTDYTEAFLIASISPKASATLSRRCLQGILRDFWGITPEFWDSHTDLKKEVRLKESGKANLWQEIKAVEQLGSVPAPIIAAFKQLKDIGNIGAHPETDVNLIVDVEPGEAEALVSLVDLIIRLTYIQRNTDEELLRQVEGIASKKAEQRGGTK